MQQERSSGFDPGLYPEQYNRLCSRYSEETAQVLLERIIHKHLAGGHAWEHFLLSHLFKGSKEGSLYTYRYVELWDPTSKVHTVTSEEQPDDDDVFDSFWRFWEKRIHEGAPCERAEDELRGFARLRRSIFLAQEESLYAWLSPPGDPSEGYGPFSMLYFGRVGRWVFDRKRAHFERIVECYTYPNDLTLEEQSLVLAMIAQKGSFSVSPAATEILYTPLVVAPDKEFHEPSDILLIVADVVRGMRGVDEAEKIPGKGELEAIHDNHHLVGVGQLLKLYAQRLAQMVVLGAPMQVLHRIKREAEEAILRFARPELARLKVLPGWLFHYHTSCPTSRSQENSHEALFAEFIPCPACGKKVVRGSDKCPHCGTRNEGCEKKAA